MNNTKHKYSIFYSIISFVLMLALLAGVGFAETKADVSKNKAPIAEKCEFKTYTDIPVAGTLSAVDPEGDAVTFALSREPKKGTVKLENTGSFTYTPQSGKKGKDAFSFVAVDALGNISAETTVTIQILKQTCNVNYTDMNGNDALYSAVYLAENDIFTGTKVGNHYCFEPEREIMRGDFLVMCLDLCKISSLSDITRTSFSDDDSIDPWLKPYIGAALVNGIITGYNSGAGVVFDADRPITVAEAMVTLENALSLTDVTAETFAPEDCPSWARQACANLSSCDITVSGSIYDKVLTRADAAKLLVSAVSVLENR